MFGFLKSRKFWFTLGGVVFAFGLLFVLFFYLFLPSYTRHGKEVKVPELTEMNLEEAQRTLEEAGLQFEVADSVFQAGRGPLDVVSQEPAGGSEVKPGRRVYLVVNKTAPPMVKFPQGVTAVSNYQAKLRLESWNLVVKEIIMKPSPYRNLVLEAKYKNKTIKPGDLLPVGSSITLIVGEGEGNELIEVPDLVGKPYAEAIDILSRLGLNMGSISYEPGSSEKPGIVIQQSPRYTPGDSINLGADVSIFISGEEPSETQEGIHSEEDKNP
jgi:beta-lactam-binding protein with PASTA domain